MEATFRHELAWYDYFYVESRCKIAICSKGESDPEHCQIFYYSKEEVEWRIAYHKFNPFLQPIFKEALLHFPQEVQNEQG